MYDVTLKAKQSQGIKKDELNAQVVGALLRAMPKISHPAKHWGDPALDALIPNFKALQAKYDYTAIIAWVFANHASVTTTYSDKFSAHWNLSDQIAVDLSDKAVPRMHAYQKSEYKVTPMSRGILGVSSSMEQLNHQLACLVVASCPPQSVELKGYEEKVVKPVPCDQTGTFGPSANVITYMEEQTDERGNVDPDTKEGGPIYRAYADKRGGTEGIVSRIEASFNKPKKFSPLVQHTSFCNLMNHEIKIAKDEGKKFPLWYNPFEEVATAKGVATKLTYQKTVPFKPFKTVDGHYITYQVMSNTCGVVGRAAYVHDGHFFADLPPGMAEKVHRLNNLMNFCYYANIKLVNITNLPPPIDKLKQLLPLNLPCMSHVAKKELPRAIVLKEEPFHDARFIPGIFKPYKEKKGEPALRVLNFRSIEWKRPSVTKTGVTYTPANPALEITEMVKDFPTKLGGCLAVVTVAHPTLWGSKDNYIRPYDLLQGLVIVARASWLTPKTEGHVEYQAYLALTSRFMQSRILYPYTRVPWPQLSGEAHSRVVLKKGNVAASDTVMSLVISQLMGEATYEWVTDNKIYEEAFTADVAPNFTEIVVKPLPMITGGLGQEELVPDDPPPESPRELKEETGALDNVPDDDEEVMALYQAIF